MWKRLLSGILISGIIAGNFMCIPAEAATKEKCFTNTNFYTFKDKAGIKKIVINGKNIKIKKGIKSKKVKFSKQGDYQVKIVNQKNKKKIYTLYIDKKAPYINGVSQNRVYQDKVDVTFIDDYALDSLIENGVCTKITGDSFSKTYEKTGHYDLIIKDKAKNKRTVSFDIRKDEQFVNIITGNILSSVISKVNNDYTTMIELADGTKYEIKGLYYLKKDDMLFQEDTKIMIKRNNKEIYCFDITQMYLKTDKNSEKNNPVTTPEITIEPDITPSVITGTSVITETSIVTGQSILKFDSMNGKESEIKTFMNGEIISLPVPEKEGYSFIGWEKDNNYYIGQYLVSGSCTLCAKWKPLMELVNLKNDFVYEIKDDIIYLTDYIGTKSELHIKDCYYENGKKYKTYVMARDAKKIGDTFSREGCLNCFTEEEKSQSVLRKVSFDENVIIYEKMDDGSIREGVWNYLFYNCPKLWTVTLPKTKCISMISMFESCSSFYERIKIPITVTNTDYMFAGCIKLVDLPVMSVGNSIISAEGMFKDCENLKGNGHDIHFSGIDDKNLSGCFMNCRNLSKGGIDIYIEGAYKDVSNIFKEAFVCEYITNIKVRPSMIDKWENALSEYSLSFCKSIIF